MCKISFLISPLPWTGNFNMGLIESWAFPKRKFDIARLRSVRLIIALLNLSLSFKGIFQVSVQCVV